MLKRFFFLALLLILPYEAWASRDSTAADTTVMKRSKTHLWRSLSRTVYEDSVYAGRPTARRDSSYEGVEDVQKHVMNASDSTFYAWPYDVVVDSAGLGHRTTLGTVSVSNRKIYVARGTYAGTNTISGSRNTIYVASGATFTGVITVSGNNNHLLFENGVQTIGIILSGNFNVLDGGGWKTLVAGGAADGVTASGTDNIIRNLSASNSTGAKDAIGNSAATMGARNQVLNCLVITSSGSAIRVGNDNLIQGNVILTASGDAIRINGVRARVIGNEVVTTSVGQKGLTAGSGASHLVVVSNTIRAYGSDGMTFEAGSDSSIITANRVDSLITNSGTGNTTTGNVVFVMP